MTMTFQTFRTIRASVPPSLPPVVALLSLCNTATTLTAVRMGVGVGVKNGMLVHQTYLTTHVKSAARASLTVHRNICSGTIDTGIPLFLPSAQGPSTLGYLCFSHLLRDHRHWDTSVSPICSGTIDIGIPLFLPSAQGPSTLGYPWFSHLLRDHRHWDTSGSSIFSWTIDIGIPLVLLPAHKNHRLRYLFNLRFSCESSALDSPRSHQCSCRAGSKITW